MRFVHTHVSSFFLIADSYFIVRAYHSLFIHSPLGGRLGLSPVFAVMKSAAMRIPTLVDWAYISVPPR